MMIERVCSSSYMFRILIIQVKWHLSIRPLSSFNTFSVIDFVYRYSRWLSIAVIELNRRLKILFDMYDQRQSLLIVNIVIYLIKTTKKYTVYW